MKPEIPPNPRDIAAKIATTAALQGIGIRKSLPLGHERIDILRGVDLRIEHSEFVAIEIGRAHV